MLRQLSPFGEHVFDIRPDRFRLREWRRILDRAGTPGLDIRNFRDT